MIPQFLSQLQMIASLVQYQHHLQNTLLMKGCKKKVLELVARTQTLTIILEKNVIWWINMNFATSYGTWHKDKAKFNCWVHDLQNLISKHWVQDLQNLYTDTKNLSSSLQWVTMCATAQTSMFLCQASGWNTTMKHGDCFFHSCKFEGSNITYWAQPVSYSVHLK